MRVESTQPIISPMPSKGVIKASALTNLSTLQSLKNTSSQVLSTLYYYCSFRWVYDLFFYPKYVAAKLAGIQAAWEIAKQYGKKHEPVDYVWEVKNGSQRICNTNKIEEIEAWLKKLPFREKCNLSAFSVTVFVLSEDNRWTSLTKDKRYYAIIDLKALTKKDNFEAKVRCGEFDLIFDKKNKLIPITKELQVPLTLSDKGTFKAVKQT